MSPYVHDSKASEVTRYIRNLLRMMVERPRDFERHFYARSGPLERLPFDHKTKLELVEKLENAINEGYIGITRKGDSIKRQEALLEELQRQSEEFERYDVESYNANELLKLDLIPILLKELDRAIGINGEYAIPELAGPLRLAFSNPNIISIELATTEKRIRKKNITIGKKEIVNVVVRVRPEEIAGTLEDYAQAVVAARRQLNYGERQKGNPASKSWMYGVYLPYLGEKIGRSNVKDKRFQKSKMTRDRQVEHAQLYEKIISSRLSTLEHKPAYWYLLNYGNVGGRRMASSTVELSAPDVDNVKMHVIKGKTVSKEIRAQVMTASDKGGYGYPLAKPTYFIERAERAMTFRCMQRIQQMKDADAREMGYTQDFAFEGGEQDNPTKSYKRALKFLKQTEIAVELGRMLVRKMQLLVDIIEHMPTTNMLPTGEILDIKMLPASLKDKFQSYEYLRYTRGEWARINKIRQDLNFLDRKTEDLVRRKAQLNSEMRTEMKANVKDTRDKFGRRATTQFSNKFISLGESVSVVNEQIEANNRTKKQLYEELNHIIDKKIIEDEENIARMDKRALEYLAKVEDVTMSIVAAAGRVPEVIGTTSDENYMKIITRIRTNAAKILANDRVPARIYIGRENGVKLTIRTTTLIRRLEQEAQEAFKYDNVGILYEIIDGMSAELKRLIREFKRH